MFRTECLHHEKGASKSCKNRNGDQDKLLIFRALAKKCTDRKTNHPFRLVPWNCTKQWKHKPIKTKYYQELVSVE